MIKENITVLIEPNPTTYAAMDAAEKEEDMFGPFDNVASCMEVLNETEAAPKALSP